MNPNIQFLQKSGLLVLQVTGRASDADFAVVPEMLGEKLGMPGTPPLSGIVVDMTGAADINETGWKKLSENLSKIPGRNHFYVVALPPAMAPLVSAMGGVAAELLGSVDEVFEKLIAKRSAAPSIRVPKATAEDTALEKQILQAFQRAAIKTLEVQCRTVFKAGVPHLKSVGPKIIHDIASSMGLMGKTVVGSVALGFKEKTFLQIMGRMLGGNYIGITSDVEDGCGELMNIIFGQAKSELAAAGYPFGKTLPTIFVGQSLRVRQLTPNPAFVMPFESDIGQMVIELGYRRA